MVRVRSIVGTGRQHTKACMHRMPCARCQYRVSPAFALIYAAHCGHRTAGSIYSCVESTNGSAALLQAAAASGSLNI